MVVYKNNRWLGCVWFLCLMAYGLFNTKVILVKEHTETRVTWKVHRLTKIFSWNVNK